jgi:hypothetical protein
MYEILSVNNTPDNALAVDSQSHVALWLDLIDKDAGGGVRAGRFNRQLLAKASSVVDDAGRSPHDLFHLGLCHAHLEGDRPVDTRCAAKWRARAL